MNALQRCILALSLLILVRSHPLSQTAFFQVQDEINVRSENHDFENKLSQRKLLSVVRSGISSHSDEVHSGTLEELAQTKSKTSGAASTSSNQNSNKDLGASSNIQDDSDQDDANDLDGDDSADEDDEAVDDIEADEEDADDTDDEATDDDAGSLCRSIKHYEGD